MATIYRRNGSPYWWIKWSDPAGRRRQESTGFKSASVSETRQARQLRAKREMEEMSAPATDRKARMLNRWVLRWMDTRFAAQKLTLASYLAAWRYLSAFLEKNEIWTVEQIRREHCYLFLEDRIRGGASRNTAIQNLNILRMVCSEAQKRGWIVVNPCSRLGLKKDAAAQKPEISEEEAATIRAFIANKPPWMRISFEIAWHQGCRLAETSLPLKEIDYENRRITFLLKGGRRHSTRLHDDLVPLLKSLKGERTWEFHKEASRDWGRAFRAMGLPHLCFHCTRVTVITRLARSGKINEQAAMRFIGHCSREIHAIYQRLKLEDLDPCVEVLMNRHR